MTRRSIKPKRVVCAVCGRLVSATATGHPRAHKVAINSWSPQETMWCQRKLSEDEK